MLAQDVIFYTMSKLFKSFDFSKVAGDDLKNLLKSELDFINESSNINRATINCTIPRVYFPIVYPVCFFFFFLLLNYFFNLFNLIY